MPAYSNVAISPSIGIAHPSTINMGGNDTLVTGLSLNYLFFHNNIGCGIDYNYANDVLNFNSEKSGLQTIPLYIVTNINLPLKMILILKAGYSYNTFENLNEKNFSNQLWRPFIGVGMGYEINKKITLYFQSSRFFLDNRGKDYFIDFYTFGVAYTFNT